MKVPTLITLLTITTATLAGAKAPKPVLVEPGKHIYTNGLADALKRFENASLAKKSDSYIEYRRWDKYGKCHEIGYGFTDNLVDAAIRFHVLPKGSKLPKKMTKAECDRYLTKVAIPTCRKLVMHYTDVHAMSLEQRDALIMFVYNLGEGTLRRLEINDKTLKNTPKKLRRFSRAGGKTLAGLKIRREFEIALFNS